MNNNKMNIKFSKIKYVRPDYDKAKTDIKSCINNIKKAKDYKEFKDNFLKIQDILDDINSFATIASIRNSLDTNDKYYEEEDLFNSSSYASLEVVLKKLNEIIVGSPFKDALTKEYGPLLIKQIENELRLVDKSIVNNIIKENKLCQKYSKDVATCQTNFRGEVCNFYGLLKHMESIDRNERKEAFLAWANLYESVSDKLDDTFDKLISIRIDKAKKLGFDNYTDYAYLDLGRLDYNKDDVKKFREQVVNTIVPVANKLYMKQKERLGLDELYYYDEFLFYKDGNATPIGSKDDLVNKANEMYHKMSKETSEYFDFMCKNELFDLETKPGKSLGGYCTFINNYKAPFIFSNFNGTSADVDVLTHEAGHAFQAYVASRNIGLMDQTWAGNEISEIHSMSMEHFAYPYMDKFFGKNVNKYLYYHLSYALMGIPYLVAVDEFQHRIYDNPSMSASDRRKTWKEVEKIYLPWRNYEDNKFLNEGGFWMQKQHIFVCPFYYIDYAIAQVCAFQFLIKSQEDKKTAWNDYLTLCKAGGTKGYRDLIKLANLADPLEDGTISDIIDKVVKIIDEFEKNI